MTYFIEPGDLAIEPTVFASGASAHVFCGTYKGSKIAVKKFLGVVSESVMHEEVKAHMALNHPNIVSCYGQSRSVEGLPLLVMDFVPHTLATLIPIPQQHRHRICAEIVSAVSYLHQHRIVHGDIKPENILVTKDYSVRLTDMGQCKMIKTIQSSFSLSNHRGSAPYASPEQISLITAPLSLSSDIFSLAVVLWEVLSGKRFLEGLDFLGAFGLRLKSVLPEIEELKGTISISLLQCLKSSLSSQPAERPDVNLYLSFFPKPPTCTSCQNTSLGREWLGLCGPCFMRNDRSVALPQVLPNTPFDLEASRRLALQQTRSFSPREKNETLQETIFRLQTRVKSLFFRTQEVSGDGNCLYRALSVGMFGTEEHYPVLKNVAFWHLQRNMSTYQSFMRDGDFDHILEDVIPDKAWGDEIHLRLLADALQIRVSVVTSDESEWLKQYLPQRQAFKIPLFMRQSSIRIYVRPSLTQPKTCYLSYLRPFHYNTLFPIADTSDRKRKKHESSGIESNVDSSDGDSDSGHGTDSDSSENVSTSDMSHL